MAAPGVRQRGDLPAQASTVVTATMRSTSGPRRSPRRSFYAAPTAYLPAQQHRAPADCSTDVEDGPLCDLLGQVTALLTQVHEILG